MRKLIIWGVIILVAMEGVVWYVLQLNTVADRVEQEVVTSAPTQEAGTENTSQEIESTQSVTEEEKVSQYPVVTTEEKNGRTERTIHMGVRKWVWEPDVIHVKQGELVRLVIHNADVRHPLVIPGLGIEADVPPEGAVVEFEVKEKGSFDFLCGTYCGVGHAEMQGTLIVE
jgi:heme/copper-type cytochrome/quinol oxidase subunit 2